MSASDAADRLARLPMFSGAPAGAVEALAERLSTREYEKGTILFRRGDPGDAVFVLETGAVKVSNLSPDGREVVVALLGPGDMLGELSIFDAGVRTADATAIEHTSALVLAHDVFRPFLQEHPAVAVHLLEVLAVRLRETNDALQDAIFSDVPGRLAKRLVDLADRYGVADGEDTVIDLALTQEQLAQMVGAARESVNKAVASFMSRGWVAMRGRRYVVADRESLLRRAT